MTQKNVKSTSRQSRNIDSTMFVIVGALLLLCGLYLSVNDIYTSAAFYNSIEMNIVNTKLLMFPTYFSFLPVTTESFVVAVFLFLINMALWMGFKNELYWVDDNNTKITTFLGVLHGAVDGTLEWKDVNDKKMLYIVSIIFVMSLDTYTDVHYRAGTFSFNVMVSQVFWVSVLAYNLGSEIALMLGVSMVGAPLWNLVGELLRWVFTPIGSGLKRVGRKKQPNSTTPHNANSQHPKQKRNNSSGGGKQKNNKRHGKQQNNSNKGQPPLATTGVRAGAPKNNQANIVVHPAQYQGVNPQVGGD